MEKILVLSIIAVIGMLSSGSYLAYKNTPASKKILKTIMRLNMLFFVPIVGFMAITLAPNFVHAEGVQSASNGLGFIAAGLSTGLASLGAGIAVANVGSSAIGAVSEDPKILGKSMIFLGLADGIAIYGLIISIMILGRL
ncbi:MAG: ATP synthase subunit C [Peptoniphilaceae bacterium]